MALRTVDWNRVAVNGDGGMLIQRSLRDLLKRLYVFMFVYSLPFCTFSPLMTPVRCQCQDAAGRPCP